MIEITMTENVDLNYPLHTSLLEKVNSKEWNINTTSLLNLLDCTFRLCKQ